MEARRRSNDEAYAASSSNRRIMVNEAQGALPGSLTCCPQRRTRPVPPNTVADLLVKSDTSPDVIYAAFRVIPAPVLLACD